MSYYRLYPTKNSTIFKDVNSGTNTNSGNVNTGKNTICQLRDGLSNSIIVMQFDLSSIKDLLLKFNYKCTLKMFDAGATMSPVLTKLKPINLYYFTQDFIEGDGWSFIEDEAKIGVCNWNKRDNTNDWLNCFSQGLLPGFELNHENDDIVIEKLEPFIADSLIQEVNPNFGLQLSPNELDISVYSKFLYSRHSRTIYKPFLEFFIDSEIIDNRGNFHSTFPTKLHLLNLQGIDFIGNLTCNITDVSGNILETLDVINTGGGKYYVVYTAPFGLSGSIIYDIWYIDNKPIKKNLLQVKSPNVVLPDFDFSGLYFYPATYYQRNLVNKGDKIKFQLVSETRTGGAVLLEDYQFRVVCTNGFEMQPWQPVELYANKLFFTIDTSYYYEELEYEVSIRLKTFERIQTSSSTYKFRVISAGPTNLTGLAATPYDDRNIYLERNTN